MSAWMSEGQLLVTRGLRRDFGDFAAVTRMDLELSAGEIVALALIAQLVHSPKVLLADEPTVGLDSGSAAEIQDIFREYAARGNALLLSPHLLDMAQNLATRIVMMAHGRIVAEGSPKELIQGGTSLHEVLMRLTGEVGTS